MSHATTGERITTVRAPALTEEPRWLADRHKELLADVRRHGAVLVRGLGVAEAAAAARIGCAIAGELLGEREAFAPRSRYAGGVYSEVSWPSDQLMCMHHELSYAPKFPGLLMFCCLVAPEEGGEITLADGAEVLRALPATLVERFERVGWELSRNHNEVVGLPWAEAFGTTLTAEVERYCLHNGIRWRWDGDGGLRTRRTLPAVISHPVTGERIWFNQIAFLNEWTMDLSVREYLLFEFGADGLPFTTRYGDQRPLDAPTVDLINEVYDAYTVREPWQAGDVLLVDNLRMAHSREPFTGTRDIVVAMGRPARRGEWGSVKAQ